MEHADLVRANQTVDRLTNKWLRSDKADDWQYMSRHAAIWAGESLDGTFADYFMDQGEPDPELRADIERLHEAYGVLLAARDAGWDETFTEILLGYSLCPVHQCDYASCFDDDNPECRAVRGIHPVHDT